MTVLVCGATGDLGGMITSKLLDKGEKVRMLVREGSDYQGLADRGAEPVFGDFKDPASLAKACEGIDTVVTTVNSAHRADESIEDVELKGNMSLIDAAKGAGVKHFIYTSVFAAKEESPVPFFAAKAKAASHLKNSGMDYTVLAPNFFMDVWCEAVAGKRVRAGEKVVVVGEAAKKHSFVSANDVADYAVASVGNEQAKGEHVNIGGANAVSWKEVISAYEGAAGAKADVESVPPKTEIGHLTPMQWNLLGALETFETVIEMGETSKKYGVQATSIEDFAKSRG